MSRLDLLYTYKITKNMIMIAVTKATTIVTSTTFASRLVVFGDPFEILSNLSKSSYDHF